MSAQAGPGAERSSVETSSRTDYLWRQMMEKPFETPLNQLDLSNILQIVRRLEQQIKAVDQAQAVKLCQVREELDRLNGTAAGEPGTGKSTTPICGSTVKSGEPCPVCGRKIPSPGAERQRRYRERKKRDESTDMG